ncbi:PREDICTED: uncharacterized protein LOC109159986 [Ipomoea nil]|uniref:uncharacterized protein LOC109159986 n=1 Tax=Ipomoea nil TaxID=35883 RepID=UPI00090147F3|nr:PREDICTED: uncharacterized protein LOC109159986 [Ipomoea nil]
MVLHQFVRVCGLQPADGHYYEDGYVQPNKHKYDENKLKYKNGYCYYDNRNKDKYDKNKKKLLLEGFDIVKEKYQDGYGDYYNRNKENKYYGGLNFKENCQNGYDHRHGNFDKDKYKENNRFYEGFNNVKEKYQDDDYSHYDNRNEDMYENSKLGLKVNAEGRKTFQDFDDLGYSSNIHYSDLEQVHSGVWSCKCYSNV